MPYGVKSPSDACQYYISQICDGIAGVTNSQDDIIIWASDENELKIN